MMYNESLWIQQQLSKFDEQDISPMLNVGSSTLYFRSVLQPFIHKNIFSPLSERNILVEHLDMKKEEGVDIVGDLLDPFFLQKIKKNSYSLVICSNLLEHVLDRSVVINALGDILNPGGYLLVTVPHLYPYHKDPIDTLFRPDIVELSSLFQGFSMVTGQVVIENDSLFSTCMRRPKKLLGTICRFLNIFSPDWKKYIAYLPYFFSRHSATCVLLRKI